MAALVRTRINQSALLEARPRGFGKGNHGRVEAAFPAGIPEPRGRRDHFPEPRRGGTGAHRGHPTRETEETAGATAAHAGRGQVRRKNCWPRKATTRNSARARSSAPCRTASSTRCRCDCSRASSSPAIKSRSQPKVTNWFLRRNKSQRCGRWAAAPVAAEYLTWRCSPVKNRCDSSAAASNSFYRGKEPRVVARPTIWPRATVPK